MTVYQPKHVLTDSPPSGASPLPHLSCGVYQSATACGLNHPRTLRYNCSCSAALLPGTVLSDTCLYPSFFNRLAAWPRAWAF